jgi:serine/threonine-protein kinase
MRIIADTARPVTELRRSVPPNVAAALARALEKVPADRFDSARAFADALTNPGFTSVTSAARAPGGSRAHRLTLLLGAVVVLLGLGLAWALQRTRAPGPAARVVRFSLPVVSDTGSARKGLMIERWSSKRLAISPDGSRLAYSVIGEQEANYSLYERRLDRGTAELLQSSPDTSYAFPFYSPDGAWLGFTAATQSGFRQLRRLSLADRSVQTIAAMDTLGATGLAWGDDGTIVAAAGSRLYRIPASGGEWKLVARASPVSGQFLRWFQPYLMPGSRMVLLHATRSYNPEHSDIVALDLTSAKPPRIVLTNAMNPIYSPTGHLLFVREGTLLGVGFDPRTATVHGQPVVLIGDVMQSLYGGGSQNETGAAQLALSASGDLAYARGGVGPTHPARVVRVTPRGDTIPVAMEHRDWILFRLSPDGARLAAVSRHGQQSEVWIHDLTRGATQRLNTGGYVNWPVAWTHDGKTLVFSSDKESPGRTQLFLIAADGSGAPRPIAPSDEFRQAADCSSQGVIAFLQRGDIWVIPPDSQPRRFFTSAAFEGYPSFSPDGRWLAYASDVSGRMEVYVRPYPGGEPATIVSTGGGTRPIWSRDGRRLLFDDGKSMMAVDLAPGPEFRPGPVHRYLASFDYNLGPVGGADIFPDGSIILSTSDPSAVFQPWGAAEIQVILDFAAELNVRVKR